MRILCVIDSLGSGGAQRQLVNLAVGFKEMGHDVAFLVYHSINFFKNVLDNNNILVNEVIEPNYIRRLLKIRFFIRRGNYDSVLSFLEAPNFICEIAGFPWRKWKLIVGERSSNPNILKSFKSRSYRWFHILSDKIISNSEENIRLVKKANVLLSKNKCEVTYNIVNFHESDNKYIFKKSGKLNLVIVARHHFLKNLAGLIEAVNILSEEEKLNIEINWYGDNYDDDSLSYGLKKIEEYNLQLIFKFHPANSNIENVISDADVVGLFSYYEGLPNAVCEAMAYSKVVIASSVSDIPKIIYEKHLLCNPRDPYSIKESLSYVLAINSDEMETIGKENRMIAERLFNKDTIVRKYLTHLSQ